MESTDKQVSASLPAPQEHPVCSLENGFVKFVSDPRPTFHLYGLKGAKPIYLNSKEMLQLAKDLPMLKNVAAKANQALLSNPNATDELLFSKTLYKSATSAITLSVDIYKGKPYIWIKRFWMTEDQPEVLNPCTGGTHFGLSDEGDVILKYVQDCLSRPVPQQRPGLDQKLAAAVIAAATASATR
jgi:hypothetical protein